MGAIAAALFLISHDESPVRDLIPDKAKPYTILATTAALGILGGVSADSKSKDKREEEESKE